MAVTVPGNEIRDAGLAELGEAVLEEMKRKMPVLQLIGLRFQRSRIFEGLKISMALHMTKETAALVLALKEGGAELFLADSNPTTVNDEVMAALAVNHGIHVYADSTCTQAEWEKRLKILLDVQPDMLADDGAVLLGLAYRAYPRLCSSLLGSTELTTSGVCAIRALAQSNQLKNPVISVNDSDSKRCFDNRFGVGQSFIQTCVLLENGVFGGKTLVICGFGLCGKGAASMAKGMGANVIVTEIDPFKAMEAHLSGYRVMPIREAAKYGDVFSTFTGSTCVIDYEAMKQMKNGALLMNCGSGVSEVDVETLKKKAIFSRQEGEYVTSYLLENGKNIRIACDGRVANIACVGGTPPEIMDLSFGIHAMALEYLVTNRTKTEKRLYRVPAEIDENISRLKLMTYGISIDTQTAEQKNYAGRYVE